MAGSRTWARDTRKVGFLRSQKFSTGYGTYHVAQSPTELFTPPSCLPPLLPLKRPICLVLRVHVGYAGVVGGYGFFKLYLELTKAGLQHLDDIVLHFFQCVEIACESAASCWHSH